MDLKIDIGKRLREFRESLGLSQKEFVKNLSVKPAAWSSYENGTSYPPAPVMYELAEKYSLDLNWLVSGENANIKPVKTMDEFIRLFMALPYPALFDRELKNYDELVGQVVDLGYCPAFCFPFSDNITEFIFDWQKIKDVYEHGIMDDELLALWIEKEIKKFKGRPIYDDPAGPEKKTT